MATTPAISDPIASHCVVTQYLLRYLDHLKVCRECSVLAHSSHPEWFPATLVVAIADSKPLEAKKSVVGSSADTSAGGAETAAKGEPLKCDGCGGHHAETFCPHCEGSVSAGNRAEEEEEEYDPCFATCQECGNCFEELREGVYTFGGSSYCGGCRRRGETDCDSDQVYDSDYWLG